MACHANNLKFCRWSECAAMMVWALDLEMKMKTGRTESSKDGAWWADQLQRLHLFGEVKINGLEM